MFFSSHAELYVVGQVCKGEKDCLVSNWRWRFFHRLEIRCYKRRARKWKAYAEECLESLIIETELGKERRENIRGERDSAKNYRPQ